MSIIQELLPVLDAEKGTGYAKSRRLQLWAVVAAVEKMCSLEGEDVPYGRIEYDLNDGVLMTVLRCPGTLTVNQMAACVPGENVTCEADGCTITGTCERVCCNSCGSSVFLQGCKASATPD